MHNDLVRELLSALNPPEVPNGLCERAMSAAARGLGEDALPADVWSRLWHSRSLRLAWTVSIAALVAGHVLLSLHRTERHAVERPAAGGTVSTQDPEIRAIAALPRIDLEAIPAMDGAAPQGSAGGRGHAPEAMKDKRENRT